MVPTSTKVALTALLGANAISMTGNVIALIAIPWFVLQTTGSAAMTGTVAFFSFLPTVIAGLVGGTLVDRLGYKKMSIVADIASGITVALIPLLFMTVGLEFWQLIALVFLGALLDAPGTTARGALIPDVSVPAGVSLESASGANQAVERASRLVGAPVAGVLIALLGPANVLWVNAATFAVSAAIIYLAVPARPGTKSDDGYLAQLREGLAFLAGDKLLRAIVGTVMATNFLDAIGMIVLPVLATQVFGDAVSLGLMLGASGGGAVIGALLFARWGKRLPRRIVFATGFVAVTLWYPVLATFPPLGIAIIAKVLSGLGAGPLNPIIDTICYERIPNHMRGRVSGVITAAAWMAIPLGVLLGGFVIEWVGLRTTILITGGAYLATTLSLWFNSAIRSMDEPRGDGLVDPAASRVA